MEEAAPAAIGATAHLPEAVAFLPPEGLGHGQTDQLLHSVCEPALVAIGTACFF